MNFSPSHQMVLCFHMLALNGYKTQEVESIYLDERIKKYTTLLKYHFMIDTHMSSRNRKTSSNPIYIFINKVILANLIHLPFLISFRCKIRKITIIVVSIPLCCENKMSHLLEKTESITWHLVIF